MKNHLVNSYIVIIHYIIPIQLGDFDYLLFLPPFLVPQNVLSISDIHIVGIKNKQFKIQL